MRIRLNPSNPVDLEVTLCCGQAFRWDKHDGWWYGVVGDRAFKTRQAGDELEFENTDAGFVEHYFGLNDDLTMILPGISRDDHIKQAVRMFRGLRILRQNRWECLISYICATYKNIEAIKQMLSKLCRKFGNRVRFDNTNFYTFPTPEKLAAASKTQLLECGLGYRADYVHETARTIFDSKFSIERLEKTSYEEARTELRTFRGVGPKAADCILLFSLGKFEAFPVDVWIKRAILRHYANHFPREFTTSIKEKDTLTRSQYEKLSLFGRSYFGKFAGYAQEYLYHYERTANRAFHAGRAQAAGRELLL
jgi:N-glycosylase/DNA lyase